MSRQENGEYYVLVALNEESPLKAELNRAVSLLSSAQESHFRPHLCLNEEEGVKVINKISRDPHANTEFWIKNRLIQSSGNLWLNVSFSVFVDKISFPDNSVDLTPRQTGYVVRSLQAEFQKTVAEKIKIWYFEEFLKNIKKGIQKVTKQFEKGDLFIEDDHRNRIFDIHGGRSMDVPYTEWEIVGEQLAPPFLFGTTCFDVGIDGYDRADTFLIDLSNHRDAAMNLVMTLSKKL